MTPLRITQSSQDWRTALSWERRTRRPHSRHIHGPIQPMTEDRSGKWFAGFALLVLGYFAIRLIGG